MLPPKILRGILFLRVETKLRAIVVAFSIGVALLLYLLVAEKNIAIKFAVQELKGNEYLRVTRGVMQAVQKQRLALLQAQRTPEARVQIADLGRPVETQMARLQGIDARLGAEFTTKNRVSQLQERWRRLQAAYEIQDASAYAKPYDDFLSDLRALISCVGDQSNLILDPDLDSYYAMDATLIKLPEEEDTLAQTIVLSHKIARARQLTPDERTTLTVHLTLLRQVADDLAHDMEVAFRENPVGNLRPQLTTLLQSKQNASQSYITLLDQRLVRAPRIVLSPTDAQASGEQALAASYHFWDCAIDELDVVLRARIAGFEQRKRNTLGGMALFLIPALLISVFLSRNIARMLNQTAQRLERLREGEITQLEQGIAALAQGDLHAVIVTGATEEPPLPVRTRDELGILAQNLNRLAAQTLSTVVSFRHTQTALAEAQAAARDSEARFRSVVEGLGEGIIITDFDNVMTYTNSRLVEMTGYAAEEMLGTTAYSLLLSPEEWEKSRRRSRHGEQSLTERFELQFRRKDGSYFWAEVHATPFKGADGLVVGTLSAVTDISDHKHFEEQLSHQAFHDGLTGLPNRLLFMERLESALNRTRQTQKRTGVLFLDLDNFKIVNDSLGHDAGDALLMAIAQRLAECVGPMDTVARLGGDEFTVLLEGIRDIEEVKSVAERIVSSLRAPIRLPNNEVFASGSLGITCSDADTMSADALLRDADTAMYQAKANGRSGYAVFHKNMNDQVVERMELETGLRRALSHNEFRVYYQPLIDLNTGKLTGTEALLRWEHPTRGLIMPGQFIPIAEETGLIVPMGYWILEEACRQTKEWQEERHNENLLGVSVNLSGKQLQRSDVVERIAEALTKTGLAPSCLKLEVTESVLMSDTDDVIAKMHRLKVLGVKLAVDDFGTGYSSISSLNVFPVDTVKIDRSFVSRLGDSEEATSIISAIIMLSRALQLDITGEGVETQEQVEHLQGLGCQIGQGYYFAKPVTNREMQRYMDTGDEAFLKPKDDTTTAYILQHLAQLPADLNKSQAA